MRSLILICGITLSISSNAQVEPVNSKENIDPSLGETNELIKSAERSECEDDDLNGALDRYEKALATTAFSKLSPSSQKNTLSEIARIKKVTSDQLQNKTLWVKNIPAECVDPNDKDLFKCTDLYFQFKGEPIHPSIINDLAGYMSDSGEQVVSINVYDSNVSDKYYGRVHYSSDNSVGYYERPAMRAGKEEWCDRTLFDYKHIGRSNSGIHILLTTESSDFGSGVFTSLIFIRFSEDKGFDFYRDSEVPKTHTRPRLLITNLGQMVLGDRWSGELRLKKNKLFIKGTTHEERILVNTPEELEQLKQKIKPIVLDLDFKF